VLVTWSPAFHPANQIRNSFGVSQESRRPLRDLGVCDSAGFVFVALSVGVSIFRSVVGFVILFAESNEQNCMLL